MLSESYNKTSSNLENLFNKDLFFLCGVIKSGTTWLERVLDSHPELICKGEAHFGSDLHQLLNRALDSYNEEMPKKGAAIAHLSKYGGHTDILSFESADADYLTATATGLMMAKWLHADPNQEKIKCVGEKTPSNLAHLPLLSGLFPEAKFIHIIRDGRDVAVSAWNFNLNTDIGSTVRRWGNFNKFVPWFAKAWSEQIIFARESSRDLGELYHEVRYEDLISSPEKLAASLFHFLKVDESEKSVLHSLNEASFEKMSGGRSSGDEDSESFFRKGVAGDWKNHFDDELTSLFSEIAGPVLEQCGYEIEM